MLGFPKKRPLNGQRINYPPASEFAQNRTPVWVPRVYLRVRSIAGVEEPNLVNFCIDNLLEKGRV
jgi:hypothetical protein